MSKAVVELKDLQTHFQTEEGTVKARIMLVFLFEKVKLFVL